MFSGPGKRCNFTVAHGYKCARRGEIRTIVGVYGAGGWVACDEHAPWAIEQSLRSLGRPQNASGWRVVVYRRVPDQFGDDGYQKVFTAVAKGPVIP